MLTIQKVDAPQGFSFLRVVNPWLRAFPKTYLRFAFLGAALLIPFRATTPSPKSPGVPFSTAPSDRPPISETLAWIQRSSRDLTQFDYAMTVRLRLLFFWVSKDDVGGGYIRRSIAKDDPRLEIFQVLFGSDPAKAPRQINRWGAGTEAEWHSNPIPPTTSGAVADDVAASAFFGFMKSSKGKSVSEMQAELKKEKDQGEHAFTGMISRVEPGHTFSLVVPLNSTQDFNLQQYAAAEPLMIDNLNSSAKAPRTLVPSAQCARAGEFLGTVAELTDAAVNTALPRDAAPLDDASPPASLCYIHDAQVNTLTLEHLEHVKKLQAKVNSSKGGLLADNTFENLLQLDFVTTHQLSGKKVYFTLLVGTQGPLRGVPVQIRYEPNWWFQVVLNLQLNSSHLAVASK
jgi:hypothetical protein